MRRWKARLLLLALTMVAMVLAFSVPAMADWCNQPFQLSYSDATNSMSACSNVPITMGSADDSTDDDWGDEWDDDWGEEE